MSRWGASTLIVLACGLAAGCTDEESWKVFRQEASETIGQGVKTVFGGIVDGIVAVVDATDTSSGDTTGGSTTG